MWKGSQALTLWQHLPSPLFPHQEKERKINLYHPSSAFQCVVSEGRGSRAWGVRMASFRAGQGALANPHGAYVHTVSDSFPGLLAS